MINVNNTALCVDTYYDTVACISQFALKQRRYSLESASLNLEFSPAYLEDETNFNTKYKKGSTELFQLSKDKLISNEIAKHLH